MLRLLNVSFNGDIHCFFQTSKSAIGFTGFVYQCCSVLENTKVTTSLMYFEYFESCDFSHENTNIDVSVFMFDLRMIDMSSECEYD
jgi:hypothetical protein